MLYVIGLNISDTLDAQLVARLRAAIRRRSVKSVQCAFPHVVGVDIGQPMLLTAMYVPLVDEPAPTKLDKLRICQDLIDGVQNVLPGREVRVCLTVVSRRKGEFATS